MTLFQTSGALLTLVAGLGWINHRYLKLPPAIGLTLAGCVFSLAVLGIGQVSPAAVQGVQALMAGVDFNEALFHGMLGILLFAGAMHVNLEDLAAQKLPVLLLATIGVALSAVTVGALVWVAAFSMGAGLPFLYCLLFGALISPTDPIAVLGVLKKAGVSKALESKITGESLFNDGTGVVLFLLVLAAVSGGSGAAVSEHGPVMLFLQEALGGLGLGLIVGYAGYRMLKSVDSYDVEILITLAMATGGYALCEAAHVSAPIAVVVMGLFVGNRGKRFAMSETTRQHLFGFWQLLDEILNAVLFALIGLSLVSLAATGPQMALALLSIPIVLLARLVSVGVPIFALRPFKTFTSHAVKLMTWGGLRGGISVALALSLPDSPYRGTLVAMTYAVVVFSILVQGTSLGWLVGRLGSLREAR